MVASSSCAIPKDSKGPERGNNGPAVRTGSGNVGHGVTVRTDSGHMGLGTTSGPTDPGVYWCNGDDWGNDRVQE